MRLAGLQPRAVLRCDGRSVAHADADRGLRGRYGARGHSGAVSRVRFSPDGKSLVSVGKGTKVWSVDTGKQLITFEGYNSVCFSPDGALLALAHFALAHKHEIHLKLGR